LADLPAKALAEKFGDICELDPIRGTTGRWI
jgi:hypothetical protein